MEYPEHEKLKLIKDKSQAIGEFFEWVEIEKKMGLAEYDSWGNISWARVPKEKLLAEFFDIDLDKLEDEKRAMLEEHRSKG